MGVIEADDTITPALYISLGVRIGLSVEETLQIPMGLLMDLWEQYLRDHGITPPRIPMDD